MRTDDAYIDDDYIVADQQRVRVPLHLMDALQISVAGLDLRDHQRGYRFDAVTDTATDATDARQAARQARDQWVQGLRDAWRSPSRDAAEPDLGMRPEEMMARHLRVGDPDDDGTDPQRQRDQTWNAYKARLAEAWRQPSGQQPSRAANEVEAQRKRWTNER